MSDSIRIVCPDCDATDHVPAARLGDGPRSGACKAPLLQAKPVALAAQRFLHHLRNSDIPLLVDFWASWCGPCCVMTPAFEEAAARLEPRMRLLKVSSEYAPGLTSELGMRSIPTLALFAGGREAARQAGAMPARGIVSWAERAAPSA